MGNFSACPFLLPPTKKKWNSYGIIGQGSQNVGCYTRVLRKLKFVILVQISRVLVNISKIFVEISEILVKNLKHNCQNLKVVKISKCFSYIIKGFCQNSGFFGLYLDGFYQIFKSLDKSLGYWLKVQRIWSNSQMCWKISKHTGHYLTALWSKSQKLGQHLKGFCQNYQWFCSIRRLLG